MQELKNTLSANPLNEDSAMHVDKKSTSLKCKSADQIEKIIASLKNVGELSLF